MPKLILADLDGLKFGKRSYREIIQTVTREFAAALDAYGSRTNKRSRSSRTALFSSLTSYLPLVPMEDAYSEHLLMVVRRALISTLRRAQPAVSTHDFVTHITEPREAASAASQFPPEANKTEWHIRYEIARLLSEMREFNPSLEIFDEVIAEAGDDLNLKGYAYHGKSVLQQNMGFFKDAHATAASNLRQLVDSLREPSAKSSLTYFAAKQQATVLRRLHFLDLPGNAAAKNEIQKLFQRALNTFDTYHVHFSRGFYFYFIGDCTRALKDFDQCLVILGPHADEYYFIHLWHMLAQMGLNPNLSRGTIRQAIAAYQNSALRLGNFKTPPADFLTNLIDKLARRHLPQQILPHIEDYLRGLVTFEDLCCVEKEIGTILKFYETSNPAYATITAQCKVLFSTTRARFVAKANLLERTSYIQPCQSVVLCVDLRGFSDLTAQDETAAGEVHERLRKATNDYLVTFFDVVVSTGDGYLLAKTTSDENQDLGLWVLEIMARIERMLAEWTCPPTLLDPTAPPASLDLGFGICCGKLTLLTLTAEHRAPLDGEEPDSYQFTGEAANTAAHLCDMARPNGVVIRNTKALRPHLGTLTGPWRFRESECQDKHGNRYKILVSPDVNDLFLRYTTRFRHFFRSRYASENRLFLTYGGRCPNRCSYCHSVVQAGPDFNLNRILTEYKAILDNPQIPKPHMLSLGCENEPLAPALLSHTAELVTRLVERFEAAEHGQVIQIATKADHDTLCRFDELLTKKNLPNDNHFTRERICLMYSICTVEHAEALHEPRRAGLDKIKDDLKCFRIVPYVKPFLPSITSTSDVGLMAFLNRFETIVVGHGYFTRKIMNRLWRACHNVNPAAAGVYEWRAIADGRVPKLPIIPPGRQGPDFLTPQFDGHLAEFLTALKDRKVFLTSPCAVAYLNKTTCYTRVGEHENPELRKLLCRSHSGEGCPNTECEFNR